MSLFLIHQLGQSTPLFSSITVYVCACVYMCLRVLQCILSCVSGEMRVLSQLQSALLRPAQHLIDHCYKYSKYENCWENTFYTAYGLLHLQNRTVLNCPHLHLCVLLGCRPAPNFIDLSSVRWPPPSAAPCTCFTAIHQSPCSSLHVTSVSNQLSNGHF